MAELGVARTINFCVTQNAKDRHRVFNRKITNLICLILDVILLIDRSDRKMAPKNEPNPFKPYDFNEKLKLLNQLSVDPCSAVIG